MYRTSFIDKRESDMRLRVFDDDLVMAAAAAQHAAKSIRRALDQRGSARIVAATGASQFEFLEALTRSDGVDWPRVELFHLDEYIGIPVTHPASFRKYMLDRLVRKTGIKNFHALEGDAPDPVLAAARTGEELNSDPVDVAFVGIGENGHLAFNDPPADFTTEQPYLIVTLDEACRRQQVGEGWFADIAEVPRRAISMSVRQILKAKEIIAVVPEARKAVAVKSCLEGEISPLTPGSILRTHALATVYLDRFSAALLSEKIPHV